MLTTSTDDRAKNKHWRKRIYRVSMIWFLFLSTLLLMCFQCFGQKLQKLSWKLDDWQGKKLKVQSHEMHRETPRVCRANRAAMSMKLWQKFSTGFTVFHHLQLHRMHTDVVVVGRIAQASRETSELFMFSIHWTSYRGFHVNEPSLRIFPFSFVRLRGKFHYH